MVRSSRIFLEMATRFLHAVMATRFLHAVMESLITGCQLFSWTTDKLCNEILDNHQFYQAFSMEGSNIFTQLKIFSYNTDITDIIFNALCSARSLTATLCQLHIMCAIWYYLDGWGGTKTQTVMTFSAMVVFIKILKYFGTYVLKYF